MRGFYQICNYGFRSLPHRTTTTKIIHCSTLGFFLGRFAMSSVQNKTPADVETQLNSFGYQFIDGELRNIKDKSRFEFNFYEDHRENQRRYEDLGKVIEKYVYYLLETEGELKRLYIPVDASPDEGRGFIFHSDNAFDCERLMIIIHGSGVVRAGQWARRLIINHSLESGSQLPYIKKAKEMGYGVLVLNSNQHFDEETGKKISKINSPEKHFNYVWREIVGKKCQAKDVAIVAHSYGGAITVDGALSNPDMLKKTFAVAFTDSVHFSSASQKKFSKWMSQNVCNWVSSNEELDTELRSRNGDCPRVSAGTHVHEETSWKAFDSVWKFFDRQWEKRKLKKANKTDTKKEEGKKTKHEKDIETVAVDDDVVGNKEDIGVTSQADTDKDKEVVHGEKNEETNRNIDGDVKDATNKLGDAKETVGTMKVTDDAMSQGGDDDDDDDEGRNDVKLDMEVAKKVDDDDNAMSQDEEEVTKQGSSTDNTGSKPPPGGLDNDEEMNSQDVSEGGGRHGGEL